jgi:hypothetical protein
MAMAASGLVEVLRRKSRGLRMTRLGVGWPRNEESANSGEKHKLNSEPACDRQAKPGIGCLQNARKKQIPRARTALGMTSFKLFRKL